MPADPADPEESSPRRRVVEVPSAKKPRKDDSALKQFKRSPRPKPLTLSPGYAAASITLKYRLQEIPKHVVDYRGWKQFHLLFNHTKYELLIRPRIWNSLVEAFSEADSVMLSVTAKKLTLLGDEHFRLDDSVLQFTPKS